MGWCNHMKEERIMKKVSTERELLEGIQGSEIMLVECKRTANVMARYLKGQGLLEHVAGVLLAPRSKGRKSYQGIPCRKMKRAELIPGCVCLVVELWEDYHQVALDELEKLGADNVVLVDYELFADISRRENPKLDFMCVGFTKCGTTSLNNAFRMNEEIRMPKGKEPFYLHWRNSYENSPERFYQKYFSDMPEGVLRGNVEPSYHVSARGVYECFGKDIKLLFMVREPVGATFSYYKMLMRRPRKMDYVDYYKRHKKYSTEIFSEFMRDKIYSEEIDRFQYDKWIGQYLKFFSRDQLKIVVFEDLLRDTKRVMDEIQDFIGVKNKLVYEELPHSNDGSSVSRGYLSAYINFKYYLAIRNRKENTELSFKQEKFLDFAKWAQKFTTVENNEKVTPQQRAELQDFYRPSVKRLGELLGRDMEKFWFK